MLRTREVQPSKARRRNIYIHKDDEEVWNEAVLYALANHASLSSVIGEALRTYFHGGRK